MSLNMVRPNTLFNMIDFMRLNLIYKFVYFFLFLSVFSKC